MEDIADAMGIKKPTLYHYVQSKAQIVGWIHDECVAAVLPALKGYLAADVSPADGLYLVARDILSLLVDKPGYLRVYFENYRDLDEDVQKRSVAERDEYFEYVKSLLRRGVESGEFDIPNIDIAARAYFGMCNWAYQWFHAGGAITTHELALQMWRIYVNGLSTRKDGSLRMPGPLTTTAS